MNHPRISTIALVHQSAADAIRRKCQSLRDMSLNNPHHKPDDYVRICKWADKQEARELKAIREVYEREVAAVRDAMVE